MPMPHRAALHPPLKLAITALIAAGAGLAAIATILTLAHRLTSQVPVFAAVTLVLILDAVLVWRELRWAVLITLAGLAGQAIAVAGIIIELTTGIAAVKAHQLQQLGFDPTTGVIINLIYSSIGFALFCWYAARRLKAHRRPPHGPARGGQTAKPTGSLPKVHGEPPEGPGAALSDSPVQSIQPKTVLSVRYTTWS
jgi:hypothetical protein